MRNFVLIIAFSLAYLYGNCQSTYEDLDINNITARLNAGPYLFCHLPDSAGYAFEMNSKMVSTIFTHSLWIGGKDLTIHKYGLR